MTVLLIVWKSKKCAHKAGSLPHPHLSGRSGAPERKVSSPAVDSEPKWVAQIQWWGAESWGFHSWGHSLETQGAQLVLVSQVSWTSAYRLRTEGGSPSGNSKSKGTTHHPRTGSWACAVADGPWRSLLRYLMTKGLNQGCKVTVHQIQALADFSESRKPSWAPLPRSQCKCWY